jgi:thioredoxin-related protein
MAVHFIKSAIKPPIKSSKAVFPMFKTIQTASLLLITVLLFPLSALASEAGHAVPVTNNLSELGKASREAGVPILLVYASSDCEYCQRLEKDVLTPLRLSGADPKQVILRKVMVEMYETVKDFDGREVETETYAMRNRVDVVPTVALVDAEGNDLVPKIVGYQTEGLYEAYLRKAIEVSNELMDQKLKAQF